MITIEEWESSIWKSSRIFMSNGASPSLEEAKCSSVMPFDQTRLLTYDCGVGMIVYAICAPPFSKFFMRSGTPALQSRIFDVHACVCVCVKNLNGDSSTLFSRAFKPWSQPGASECIYPWAFK